MIEKYVIWAFEEIFRFPYNFMFRIEAQSMVMWKLGKLVLFYGSSVIQSDALFS